MNTMTTPKYDKWLTRKVLLLTTDFRCAAVFATVRAVTSNSVVTAAVPELTSSRRRVLDAVVLTPVMRMLAVLFT